MHAVVYQSIVIFYLCWNLVNGSSPVSKYSARPFPSGPSGRNDGNDFSTIGNIQSSVTKSNVLTRLSPTGYRGLALNNKLRKKAELTIKTKLNAQNSKAEFDEENENFTFIIGGVNRNEIVNFYDEVYNTLKQHLLDCLQLKNTDKSYALSKFVDFMSIKQNLLNNSIALLLQSELDITQLMRLYLFFCSPFQEPDNPKKGLKYREFRKRIFYIQEDIKDKFKGIIGDYDLSNKLHVNPPQMLKEKTELKLLSLATRAIYKMEPNGPLLPGTPLHFVCIDLLKWTALMESDNEDAREIQQMTITIENSDITMKQYAERYRYEIDIRNLDQLNYEVLLRINNTLLYYLYKHFDLSMILINTNISKFKSNDAFAISSAIIQIEGFRAFLEIFDLFFVTRYLLYVKIPTAQTKLTDLISYIAQFSANLEDTAREMQQSPEKTVNDINQLITEFAMALLLDLNVNDRKKWIDGAKKKVVGTTADITSALKINKQKGLAIMALCVSQLNPDWPNIRYWDPTEFLTATQLAHKSPHTKQYDSEDDNIYL